MRSNRLVALCALLPLAWGCVGRTAPLGECALFGALAGAGAGAATGRTIGQPRVPPGMEDPGPSGEAIGAGVAIGFVAGAVIGYGLCALIREAEPEPAAASSSGR